MTGKPLAEQYRILIGYAEEAAAEARETALPHVRDRALRAAATWRSLAEKARLVARARERASRDRKEEGPAKPAHAPSPPRCGPMR